MLGEPVHGTVADAPYFLVGPGEVEASADMPPARRIEQRDSVGSAGQPAQNAAGLLPVWVRVVASRPTS